MSQPAAIAAAARAGTSPDSAFMSRSSVTSSPWKPMRRRMTLSTISDDSVEGRSGSQELKTTLQVNAIADSRTAKRKRLEQGKRGGVREEQGGSGKHEKKKSK